MKTWEDLDKSTHVFQESYDQLCKKYNTLQTFRDAQEWDSDARALISSLQDFKNDWILFRKEQESKLEQLKRERHDKSFFNRVLSSRSSEDELEKLIKQIDLEINGIDPAVNNLVGMMDRTPANKSEQQEIADVIREFKKEYALLKRENNEALRQTRATARHKTANWTGAGGGVIGSVARYQRTSIRMEKERALVPMEDMKAFIERKLISLDRELKWVMHFKDDGQEINSQPLQDTTIPEQMQRCAYCGRSLTYEDVCPGCGAAI